MGADYEDQKTRRIEETHIDYCSRPDWKSFDLMYSDEYPDTTTGIEANQGPCSLYGPGSGCMSGCG